MKDYLYACEVIMKMIDRKCRTKEIVDKIMKEFGVSERTAFRYISSVKTFRKFKRK